MIFYIDLVEYNMCQNMCRKQDFLPNSEKNLQISFVEYLIDTGTLDHVLSGSSVLLAYSRCSLQYVHMDLLVSRL